MPNFAKRTFTRTFTRTVTAPLDDLEFQVPGWMANRERITKMARFCYKHLNFYRVHLLYFTLTPFVVGAIFYASNGHTAVSYIDSLFMCASSITVTGLNSILIEPLTVWQQVILLLLMISGSPITVSIVTLLVRRHFFRKKFKYLIRHNASIRNRIRKMRRVEDSHSISDAESDLESAEKSQEKPRQGWAGLRRKPAKLSVGMIKRVDVPVKINAMNISGLVREESVRSGGESESESESESSPSEHGFPVTQARQRPPKVSSEASEENGNVSDEIVPVVTDKDTETPAGVDTRSPIDKDKDESDAKSSTPPRSTLQDTRSQPMIDAKTTSTSFEKTDEDDVLSDSPVDIDDDQRVSEDAAPQKQFELQPPPPLRFQPPSATASILSPTTSHGVPLAPYATSTSMRHNSTEPGHITIVDDSRHGRHDRHDNQPHTPHETLAVPRSRTIDFAHPHGTVTHRSRKSSMPVLPSHHMARTHTRTSVDAPPSLRRTYTRNPESLAMRRTQTKRKAKNEGFGGFPSPVLILVGAFRKLFPKRFSDIERTLTMNRTRTMQSIYSEGDGIGGKFVSYLSFDALVGRNSRFYNLTEEQEEELGGVEYRSLTVLIRIVAGYLLFWPLLGFIINVPVFVTSGSYKHIFSAAGINKPWFTFFQNISAFTNCGLSLIDASMLPFATHYLLLITMIVLILAGNTAYPMFLRCFIWIMYRVLPGRSKVRESLQFLLDHPRRCYLYLFPRHQTILLAVMILVLTMIDWVSFLVLDIGNPTVDAIPVGTRIVDGLFQSVAVRCAGFGVVSLTNVAPALQMLMAVMMYIAVYPMAVSIRSTNVYEERSIGLYRDDDTTNEDEGVPTAFSYLAYHARKQLAFDMWWLVFALWLLCIVERHKILSGEFTNVTIFTLMFEVCSSYGTVGLSMGAADKNTSLSGDLSTLSKLIIICVMIRGRHRGLPHAIDRAVVLPDELRDRTGGDDDSDSGDDGGADSGSDSTGSDPAPSRTTQPALTPPISPPVSPTDFNERAYFHFKMNNSPRSPRAYAADTLHPAYMATIAESPAALSEDGSEKAVTKTAPLDAASSSDSVPSGPKQESKTSSSQTHVD